MSLRYSNKSGRYYDDSTGRFVSASRGRLSSTARADYKFYVEEGRTITREPSGAVIETFDIPKESPAGTVFDSRLPDEQFTLWGYYFEEGELDRIVDAYYDLYDIDDKEEDKYE